MDNTRVNIFTRIPHGVSRSWRAIPISLTAFEGRDPTKYESSLISSIELTIHFNESAIVESDIFTEHDDIGEDRLEVWTRAQKVYSDLVELVSARLRTYSKEMLDEAREHKSATVELPREVRTRIIKNRVVTSPTVPQQDEFPDPSTLSKVSTVRPRDSASQVSSQPSRISSAFVNPLLATMARNYGATSQRKKRI